MLLLGTLCNAPVNLEHEHSVLAFVYKQAVTIDCAISETETLRVRNVVDATRCFFCFFLGCTVASRGGYQMARGRHYAKLSLSNAARLSFSDLCILLFMFLSLCRLCVCVFLCSHWSLVDVPLIFFCPADHVPDWQPRVLLGMVEARSVNVKKTTTTIVTRRILYVWNEYKTTRSK